MSSMRRAAGTLLAASMMLLVLAGCGSGPIVSPRSSPPTSQHIAGGLGDAVTVSGMAKP